VFVGWLSSTKLENAEITIRIVDCTPALVPRRSDLAEAGGLRQVPAEDGQKFAAELGVPFLEASAKTGEYVDTAFLLISSQIKEKMIAQTSTSGYSSRGLDDDEKKDSGGCC